MKKLFVKKISTHILIKTILTCVITIVFTQAGYAAIRTWDGGGSTNNWSEAANWSTDTVPVDDTAVFDATSTKDCVIDINLPSTIFLAINLNSGYTGTVSIASGINTNFRAGGVFASGTFTANDGTVSFTQNLISITGGTFNAGSGTANLRVLTLSSGSFNGSSGNVTSDGITINGGTFNAPTGALELGSPALGGSLTVNAGTFNANNGTLVFLGGVNSTFSFGAAVTLNNLTINKSEDVGVGFTGTATVNGTLTLTEGLINSGTIKAQNAVNAAPTFGSSTGTGGSGLLLIQDGGAPRTIIFEAGSRLPNVTVNDANATINTSGTGTIVSDDFILTAGAVDVGSNNWTQGFPFGSGAPFTQNGGTFTIGSGNFTMNTFSAFTQNGGVFNHGNGTFTAEGTFFVNGGTFNASTSNSTVKRGFTVGNSATFNANSGTITLVNNGVNPIGMNLAAGGVNFNNLSLNVGVNFSGGNPIVNGTFTQVSGSTGSGQLQLKGNMVMEMNAFGGTTALLFNGTGNQTYTNNLSLGNFSGTWTINKPSGVFSLASDLTLLPSQTLTITSGEFSQGASGSLTVGSVSVGAAGFWRNNGTGDIMLGGNVTNAGEIDIDGTTVSCNEADAVVIRSTVNGTQRNWSGAGSFFVQDADVRDQAGTAPITSFAGTNTSNNGANWTFNGACAPFVWDGGGATNDWTEAANWRRNLQPLLSSAVVFDGTSVKNAVVDADISVDGIQINGGYTGVISWSNFANHLTVGSSGFSQNSGSVQSGRLTVNSDMAVSNTVFQAVNGAVLDINGNLTVTNSNFSFASNANTSISGNFSLISSTAFNSGAQLILDGNSPITLNLPTNTEFSQFTINKSGNSAVNISPSSNIIVNQNLVLLDGLVNGFGLEVRGQMSVGSGFDGGTGSLTIQNNPIAASGTIADGAILPDFVNLNSSTYSLDIANSNGTLTFQNFNLQNGTVQAGSNQASTVVFNGLFTQTGGTFQNFDSAQTLIFNGNFALGGGLFAPGSAAVDMNADVTLTSGTFTSTSGILSAGNNFTRSSPNTFNHNNGTIVFDGMVNSNLSLPDAPNTTVFNNLRFDTPNSKTINSNAPTFTAFISVGSLEFNNGFILSAPSGSIVEARGNVLIGSGLDNGISTTIKFAGSSNQTFTHSGGFESFNWTVDKSAGTVNLANDLDISDTGTAQNLTLDNGTITTGANRVIVGAEDNVSQTNGFVIGNLRRNFDTAASKAFDVGTANGYSPVNVNATTVNGNSSLTINADQTNRAGMDPTQSAQRFWTLAETGDLTADLTFNYLQADVVGTEANYQLFKWNGGTVLFVPSALNTATNTIDASGISEFSDWAIGNLVPTAASVTVGGRVLADSGRGIYMGQVTLTDTNGYSRTARTNPFGYYRFDAVSAGASYVVSVAHKAYQFANPSRIVFVMDNILDVDFIALNQAATNSKPSISGRVTNAQGEGLADVSIELLTASSKQPQIVKTDEQGYYSFEDLTVGETYFINVNSKMHRVTNANRVFTLLEDIADADFVSLGN